MHVETYLSSTFHTADLVADSYSALNCLVVTISPT